MTNLINYEKTLAALKSRDRYRALLPQTGHDFSSNDYLGLAGSDILKQAVFKALERGVPVGSGGSRLLRGNAHEHEKLEEEAASFFGTQSALFMGGGFNANLAIFATLPKKGDLIVYDNLIHASIHDGMRLNSADCFAFRHNDKGHAEDVIKAWRKEGGKGTIFISIESVYSMEGDKAPLADFITLSKEHEAFLIVDEAHATGFLGSKGRGLSHEFADYENLITLHTCGKALGVSGALICGKSVLIDILINKARSFIYTTAPSPLNAALVRVSLEILESGTRQKALQNLVLYAQQQAEYHLGLKKPSTQIIPVIIGGNRPTMMLSKKLQEKGFDIRGIRPPTVPRGTARLRASITLNVTKDVIAALFKQIALERKALS